MQYNVIRSLSHSFIFIRRRQQKTWMKCIKRICRYEITWHPIHFLRFCRIALCTSYFPIMHTRSHLTGQTRFSRIKCEKGFRRQMCVLYRHMKRSHGKVLKHVVNEADATFGSFIVWPYFASFIQRNKSLEWWEKKQIPRNVTISLPWAIAKQQAASSKQLNVIN